MSTSSTSRLTKNTLLLYIRQFFTLGIAFYTSRLTLQVLGVTDFGIYTTVGGLTALLSILTSSMSSSTQRFMTYELGAGNHERLNRVYTTSLQIHMILAIGFLILAETIGTWFIFNAMQLPKERITTAFIVFQFTIATSCLTLINVPNSASIVAHEDMGVFSLFSILDAVLKLGGVFALFFITWDKLTTYALTIFLIQFLAIVIGVTWCRTRYAECRYRHCNDKTLRREMFGLAGWNAFSNISVLGFIQGANIVLNLFFGPAMNAAYAVAMQAYSGIRSFTSSFQLASNPQIIKTYAEKDSAALSRLVYFVCRSSFYLIFLMALPFLLNAEAILDIWLDKVPEHTVVFFRILLIYAMIDVWAYPLNIAAQATGEMRRYSLYTSMIIILPLPLSCIAFWLGAAAQTIYHIAIFTSLIGIIVGLLCLSKMTSLSVRDFIRQVMLRCLLVALCAIFIPLAFHHYIQAMGLGWLVASFLITLCSTIISIWLIGLDKGEKEKMITIFNSKFKKQRQHSVNLVR